MPNLANTVRFHRVLRATPERVYRAFLDPDAMTKWLPPHGFTGKVHEMDARVGGGYRMSFTNFGTGKSHSFGGTYVELTPHERIRHADRFDDPNLPGEFCYLGWQGRCRFWRSSSSRRLPTARSGDNPLGGYRSVTSKH